MSKHTIQEPTVTDMGNQFGLKYEHPAYAQIGASRISGGTVLYGSDFLHQHFVRIRIAKSALHRDLSRDWFSSSVSSYIEVDLSEAQWASFVSSMNVGGGTPCTLVYLNGEMVPGLPDPANRKDQFKAEAKAKCDGALQELAELREAIKGSSLSQKAKDALTGRANGVEARLTNALPFVLEQFGEHMEQTVEKAKTEINSYATQTVMRAGIQALGGEGGTLPILSLAAPQGDGTV